MPKVTNTYYQFGYVRAKMQEIQAIADRLSDSVRIFTNVMLNDLQNDLERIHGEIQSNLQSVDLEGSMDLLRQYEQMSIIADRELLQRRLELEPDEPSESGSSSGVVRRAVRRIELERSSYEPGPHTGAVPKRKVIVIPSTEERVNVTSGPSQASALIEHLTKMAAERKKGKKGKKKVVRGEFSFGDEFDEPQGPYAENASDNEDPLPPALCSSAQPAAGFQPIRFPSNDLRNKISFRQEIIDKNRREEENPSTVRPVRPARKPESPRYIPLNEYRGQSSFVGSVGSSQSYRSTKQQPMRGIVTGIIYPPRGHRLPDDVTLNKNDPNIIGMAEFYVQTINNKVCAHCRGHHRLFNCTSFLREGLQRRWYIALNLGVCLFCLYPGHSSFTCRIEGTCDRCGQRHNSRLCPKREFNY
jgi:hypothetical protein